MLFVFLLFLLGGCQQGLKVNYVEGIVTLDGVPVEAADVSFVPPETVDLSDLTGPVLGSGRTDANGKFTISTFRGSKVDAGTTIGNYTVTIVKKELANPPTGPVEGAYMPRWLYHVPKIFEDSLDSPIKIEVVKGKNTFTVALKGDGTFEVTK